MLAKTVQDGLNEQVQKEFYSAYLYLAMSAYCEVNTLPGSAKWLRVQAQEETGHGLKIVDYLTDRGARVMLRSIAQPPAEFASLLDVFQQALAHEREVTKSINQLYALAAKENDYATQSMLQWFITEQVEEEKSASLVAEQLKLVGESKPALIMLDHHLGKRGAE
ncbi:MAG: ferritin [Candidatus Methylomirabilales bacterium]